jgi:putative tricarboxylic transport membrane protein
MSEYIISGLSLLAQPINILLAFVGAIFGVVIGAIPGLSATMGITLLIPLTFALQPASGLIMLAGIYCGAIYGGSIAAILVRTPGTPAAVATMYDGYPLTLQGKANTALGVAIFSSAFGGIFSAIVLLFVAYPIARIALEFRSPEMFWLAVFGMSIIASLGEGSITKGFVSAGIGLLIASIGMHPLTGQLRFTFGQPSLYSGVPIIIALIGLFSPSQSMIIAENPGEQLSADLDFKGSLFPGFGIFLKNKVTLIRSAIIGTFIGAIPGAGAEVSSFVAYNEAKRWSKEKHTFGKGNPVGVMAPETANNAVTGGSLIPLLTLGIPGNSSTAALIGGLMIHGLIPGPKLFTESANIIYAFILSLFLVNVFYVLVGFYGLKYVAKVVNVPKAILAPTIITLSVVGSFAMRNNIFDVWTMILFGLLGYILRKMEFPLAPIVLAIILGPIAESNLDRAITIAGARNMSIWGVFFQSPVAVIIMVLTALSIMAGIYGSIKDKKQAQAEQAE